MVINTNQLMEAIAILTDDRNMRVTLKHSGKGALVCGASCFIGGLVGGPVGMAVGGTLGGIQAYRMSRGQFRSVGEVIRHEMTERQREMLRDNILAVASDLEITDLAVLLPMLMNSQPIQAAVLRTVTTFISNEMRLKVLD